MDIVQIKFANQRIELACNNKKRVLELAQQINERLDDIRQDHPNSNTLQLTFFIALTLLNEVEQLCGELSKTKEKLDDVGYAKKDGFCNCRKLEKLSCQLTNFIENSAIALENLS